MVLSAEWLATTMVLSTEYAIVNVNGTKRQVEREAHERNESLSMFLKSVGCHNHQPGRPVTWQPIGLPAQKISD